MSFSHHDSRPATQTHHIDDGSRFKVLEDHTKKQKPKVCRQEEEISNAPQKSRDIQPATHQRTTHMGRYRAAGKQAQVRSSKLRDTKVGKHARGPSARERRRTKPNSSTHSPESKRGMEMRPQACIHPSRRMREGAAGRGGR